MDDRAFLRTLIAAPVAAVFGSTTCTLGWLWVSDLFQRPSPEPKFGPSFAQMWVMVSVLTLIGTAPGALLFGTPVCYALRRQLSVDPLRWALPLAAIGGVLGGVGAVLFLHQPTVMIGGSYGAVTAIGFALWFASRRPNKRPMPPST